MLEVKLNDMIRSACAVCGIGNFILYFRRNENTHGRPEYSIAHDQNGAVINDARFDGEPFLPDGLTSGPKAEGRNQYREQKKECIPILRFCIQLAKRGDNGPGQ